MRLSSAGFSPQIQEGEKRVLNSELWHACVRPLVSLPLLGSRVVYFPQGHSEQFFSEPNRGVFVYISTSPSPSHDMLLLQMYDSDNRFVPPSNNQRYMPLLASGTEDLGKKKKIMNPSTSANYNPSYSTRSDQRACLQILCSMENLPYMTLKAAKEAVKDSVEAIFFIQLSEKDRIEWLRDITSFGFRNKFDRWPNNRNNPGAPPRIVRSHAYRFRE